MKKISSILAASLMVFATISCEDEDKDRLEIANITGGAILRTLESSGATVNREDPSQSTISATVEFDDFKNDDTLESVDYFLQFIDTSPVGGVVMEVPEVMIGNVPASAFSAGSNGPTATISVNMAEGLTALGVSKDDLYGGDIFLMRLVLKTTDGQVFTSDNVGVKIQTSSAFSSPFRYSSAVVCPPPAGDWQLELQDSYGDGWNGAAIVTTVNDDTVNYTIDGGSSASYTVNVPPGSTALAFTFQGGDWDSEVTYQIIAPDGSTVADNGPTPDVGPIKLTLDFCAP